MKSCILICLVCLMGVKSAAQEKEEKIEPDRPGEGASPAIVPAQWMQPELGLQKENNSDNYTLYYPTALLRYGISKKVELRLQADVASEYEHLIPNPKTTNGLEPVEIGGKLQLLEAKGMVPHMSLLAQVGLPFLSSAAFHTPHLIPSFRLLMQNSLTDETELNYNLGAEWDGEGTTPSWLYTIAPGVDFGEKWFAFIEAYGFIKKNEAPQHSVDAGFAYTITNNTQVDVSGGVGLSKAAPDQFIMIGFSFRIPVSGIAAH